MFPLFSDSSCPNIYNENSTDWIYSGTPWTAGVCAAGYTGSPMRQCLRADGAMTWSPVSNITCQPLPITVRLAEDVVLLAVVFGLVVFFFLFAALVYACTRRHLHKFGEVHPKPSLIFLIPLSWINLVFNGYFLSNLVLSGDLLDIHTAIAILAFLFGLGFNIIGGAVILWDFHKKHRGWITEHFPSSYLAFFLGIANISNMNLITSRLLPFDGFNAPLSKIATESLSDLALGVHMFKDLPILIIQVIAISTASFVSNETVVSLILTGITILFGYSLELHRWIVHREEYFDTIAKRRQSQDERRTSRVSRGSEVTTEQVAVEDPVFDLSRVDIDMKEIDPEKAQKTGEKTADDSGETTEGGKDDAGAGEAPKKTSTSGLAGEKRTPPAFSPPTDLKDPGKVESGAKALISYGDGALGPDGFYQRGEEPLSPFYWVWVYTTGLFLAPGVLLSLAFQFCTILGAPFAVACFRRYVYIFTGDYLFKEVRQYTPIWTLHWYEQRGFYLLPINILAFVYIGCYFFPTVSALGAVVLICTLLGRICYPRVSFSFRRYYDFVLTCLIWAYIPVWGDPPRIYRDRSIKEDVKPARHVVITSVLFFLGLEFALPFSDHITDLIYAASLLTAYQDPYLQGRDTLYAWIIVGFTFAAAGILSSALHFFWMAFRMFFSKQRVSFLDFALGQKGLERSHLASLIKFFDSGVKSIVQLIVATSTVSYVSNTGPLWIATVGFSIASISLTVSGVFCMVFYARDFHQRARFVVQTWFFVFLVVLLSNIAKVSIEGDFCARNRTITTTDEMDQVVACSSLQFPFSLAGYTTTEALDFESTVFTLPISFTNNANLSDISFDAFESPLNTTITLTNNVLGSFSMSNCVELQAQGGIIMQNNTFQSVSFPALQEIDGVFSITGGVIPFLDLSGVEIISGSLTVSNTPLSYLYLSKLAKVQREATLAVTGNQNLTSLDFGTLQEIGAGAVVSITGSGIYSLQFNFLQAISGALIIDANPQLVELLFPALTTISGTLVISNNGALTSLAIGSLDQSSLKHTQVSQNPLLSQF